MDSDSDDEKWRGIFIDRPPKPIQTDFVPLDVYRRRTDLQRKWKNPAIFGDPPFDLWQWLGRLRGRPRLPDLDDLNGWRHLATLHPRFPPWVYSRRVMDPFLCLPFFVKDQQFMTAFRILESKGLPTPFNRDRGGNHYHFFRLAPFNCILLFLYSLPLRYFCDWLLINLHVNQILSSFKGDPVCRRSFLSYLNNTRLRRPFRSHGPSLVYQNAIPWFYHLASDLRIETFSPIHPFWARTSVYHIPDSIRRNLRGFFLPYLSSFSIRNPANDEALMYFPSLFHESTLGEIFRR